MIEYCSQKTLKQSIFARGNSLHTNKDITITLYPAPVDHGIVFERTDSKFKEQRVTAHYDKVCDLKLNTTLCQGDLKIRTVEHILAALAGMGIDNCLIKVDGDEIPIMDGSSIDFVTLIDSAGIQIQEISEKKVLQILKEVTVEYDGKMASLSPCYDFEIDFEISFESQAIGYQRYKTKVTPQIFKKYISKARTFGFLSEIDHLQKLGLCLGGNLDNAIVLQGDKVLNEEGLRYPNEFVIHKILDAIGDLSLAGLSIAGYFKAVKSGHYLNNLLLYKLFSDSSAYKITTMRKLKAEQRKEGFKKLKLA